MTIKVTWDKHIKDPSAPTDADAITDTIGWIFEYASSEGVIDITDIDLGSCNIEHLCALLCLQFVPVIGRESTIKRVEQYCIKHELDAEDLLYGMI